METVKSTSGRHDSRSFIEIKPYGPVPLACAACRYRKSRCDKTRPRCGRCVKFGINCVYPGSRKPVLRKHKNAEELEDRLAQVEDRINKARQSIAQKCHSKGSEKRGKVTDPVKPGNLEQSPQFMTFRKDSTLPLQGIIESLTETFFRLPYSDMIIIHPARYMQAFRGDTTQKPPQYLQYAICALAAIGNSMDDSHHFFYQRARQSLEAVNSKVPNANASRVWIKANPSYEGLDEQHVSIHHAQAWILISLYEDKVMLFTRAIMSIARTRQICLLMGLNLLDSEHRSVDHELSRLSWVELEECRRVFWCSFVLDAFASMSTGLPSLINMDNVAIRLPASDDAFISEVQEETSFLHTILEDAQVDGFAGIVMLCQVFKDILRHTIESSCAGSKGRVNMRFWSRHHEIDERISRISKLLPGNLSLPPDPLNVPNIRINLTLQASIICLHHSAIKECKQHDSLRNLAQTSISCLQSASERAMDIIESMPDSTSILQNTLCSLSLYLVTTALVFMAKQGSVSAIQDLGVTVSLMEKISPTYKLTRVFLHQVCSDMNLSGLDAYIHISASGKSTACTNQITPPSSGSVSSHNTAPQEVQPSSMKQRNLAAWAVEEDPGSLAWDCFSALLAPAKHNASAANRMMVLNRGQYHVSSVGSGHMMSNGPINAVSRHGPAMIGNQLIDANEVQQDYPLPSALTAEELMLLDDPLTWAGSWGICDNNPDGTFDGAPHSE